MLLQLQMEIKCSPEVRILRQQNSRTLWSLAKRHLKRGGQIVGLIFLYGNSSDSNIIFQMFPSLTMQKKFNIADHYRLASSA